MKRIILLIVLIVLAFEGYEIGRTWREEIEAQVRKESFVSNKMSEENFNLLSLQISELRYADLLHDSWVGSLWLKNKQFSPNKSAANYSFLYILFRVLDEAHPASILELGLGQTTQMTTQFAKYFHAHLDVIEDDAQWIEIYKNRLPLSANAHIHLLPLETFMFEENLSQKYGNLAEVTKDQRYNLIIIDGPIGYLSSLSRSNILDLVPQNLAEDFVIIFDDVNRPAEALTLNLLETLLKENNISYSKTKYKALKTQAVLAGGKYEYVTLL